MMGLDVDFARRMHLDMELTLEDPPLQAPRSGPPRDRGPKEETYWTGEAGLTYKFRENLRLRLYYLTSQNDGDEGMLRPRDYMVQEVGASLRWFGSRPADSNP